ncbi:hypothetical protein XM38_037800 [Halomicronema hongdechloris C2206]|uniref:Selenide, water dikinase n=1 Tax=Halomicronema hongdechloris C2206 TaxID=1641165 RepID=A0A1Z3HR86_9CYAN|nr:selenide, water dikinase SelD [Halomicronema hongdechloris]ASC72821.1 hypothetical protein XM38_037800 [Halomicronema hongdechloris C2206]
MESLRPIVKDLVLLGGGHSHAIVLRQWGMRPLAGVQITLITNLADTPYSGMLPSHVAGLYDFDQAHIDLRPLTRFAQARLFMDRVIGLDLERRRVICAHHPPVAYDVLSIDTGSTPAMVAVPGAADHAVPAKPVPQLLQAWARVRQQLEASPERPLTIAVVGGGIGGVELTLNMQARLQRRLKELGRPQDQVTFHLFHRRAELAPERSRATRHYLQRLCLRRRIQLHLQQTVAAVETIGGPLPYRVRCESGLTVACDRIFWVTQAAAPDWVRQSGLANDSQGFIAVADTLQSRSHPNVFAAGDVATMVNHPRPKAGVFAVRQGKPLSLNLRRHLQGQPLQPFRPQRQFLTLIDTGRGTAIASRGPFVAESCLFRYWKDHIDQKFMALFRDFPEMGASRPSDVVVRSASSPPPMYCAGCGSKVGRPALEQVLQRIQADVSWPVDTADILVGLTAAEDAAVVRVPHDRAMVHTADGFRALLADPFICGQIAVHHSLSDLFAMGATPQSVLALATVPYALPAQQTEILYQLLSGVQKALSQSHTPLVGGHTSEGPELVLSIVANGLAQPQRLLRKQGMAPGEVLILTKPLGTGVLFAADMRRQAKGRWIEAAVAVMVQSNQAAAQCLIQHQATACTDVTGFGFMGHLLELVQASQVGAVLTLNQLPALQGARQVLAQGVRSSLHPQNQTAAQAIENGADYIDHPDWPLLFDPQTSGGLLAAVPPDQVESCLATLHQAGYAHSLVVGRVIPRDNPTQPIRIEEWGRSEE